MLKEILKSKKIEIKELKKKIPHLQKFKKKDHLFFKTLKKNKFSIIAEVKRKSPTAGDICPKLQLPKIAYLYKKGKVDCISVLTDKNFFGAKDNDLLLIKKFSGLPVLKKDFIIDKIQIYQAFYEGADAILLIASILTLEKLKNFLDLAKEFGLDCLVEVHNLRDLEKVLKTSAKIIGINNRDLKTGKVDLKTTFKLVPYIPKDCLIISESGIKNKNQVRALKKIGVRGILVGESILKSENILEKIKELKEG